MLSIRETLKNRDGITDEDFDYLLQEFHEDWEASDQGLMILEDLIRDYFGLEPDYIMDDELGIF